MPEIIDLLELKSNLEIDLRNTNEDKKLLFFIDEASDWISELLGRDIFYKSRTQFYKGTGTQKLVLRNRPVFSTPTIQVFEDEAAYYGSAPNAFTSSTAALTYGTDFALQIDQDDGVTSRSAILIRINALWPKPKVRQVGLISPFIGEGFGTLKVIYTAGFTSDTLPSRIKMAMVFLIAKMRQILPYGFMLQSESYEDRSISFLIPQKRHLLDLVWPMIGQYRNWKF